jgi:hypothetical protein
VATEIRPCPAPPAGRRSRWSAYGYLVAVHGVRLPWYAVRAVRHAFRPAAWSTGAAGFYLVAVFASAVSVNTSWQFLGQIHVHDNVDRAVLSGVLAMAFAACVLGVLGSRRSVMRVLAAVVVGLSAYMAMAVSGWAEGLARIALGPALVAAALYLALDSRGDGAGSAEK